MVLGAGIVGVATALYLQRAGLTVTIIDRGAPGEGCSKGNAGVISTGSVVPLPQPGIVKEVPRMLFDSNGPLCIRWRYLPRLLPWLYRFLRCANSDTATASAAALAALQAQALDAYWPLLDRAGARTLVRTGGWLLAYESERAYAADERGRMFQRHHQIRFEELAPGQLQERVPALANNVKRGVFFPDTAYTINPLRLVEVLADDFKRHGGELIRAHVSNVVVESGDRIRVQTNNGPHETTTVVVALGAWSGKLAATLGNPVPLDTERGYHVMLPQAAVELPLPIMFMDKHFAASPMEHGLRLAGTVEFAGLEAPPNYKRARILMKQARRLIPGLDTTGASEWMGFRPTVPDYLPIIGRSPRYRNVYFAFAHQHLGLTLAAVTGRLIANLVAGGESSIDLTPYRIDRF